LATGVSLKKKYWRGDNRLNNLIDPKIKDDGEDKDKLEKILDNCLLKLKGIINDFKDTRQTAYDPDVVYVRDQYEKMDVLKGNDKNLISYFHEYIQDKKRLGEDVRRSIFYLMKFIGYTYPKQLFELRSGPCL